MDSGEVKRVLRDAFWRYVELATELRQLPHDAAELAARRARLEADVAEIADLLGGDPLHVLPAPRAQDVSPADSPEAADVDADVDAPDDVTAVDDHPGDDSVRPDDVDGANGRSPATGSAAVRASANGSAAGNGRVPPATLAAVRAALPGSITEIGAHTGASRHLVRRALAELAQRGEVAEDGEVRGTGGRPAVRYVSAVA